MISKGGTNGPLKYIVHDTLQLIKDSLIQIILTLPGERIMNPDFGCRLRMLHFENLTDTLKDTMTNVILDAIERWEPRVTVTADDIFIQASNEIGSSVSIRVAFKVNNPDFISTQDPAITIVL
jgi:phage baseplate assembly protein W